MTAGRPKPDSEIQYELANQYFTQVQTNVADRLDALKKALPHAIQAWLYHHNEDRFIFRIAQAFLYATADNLNKNVEGISYNFSEFFWLREELDKTLLNPPTVDNHDAIERLAENILKQLSKQRLYTAPIYLKLTAVTAEKEDLQQRVAKLENEMEQLKLAVENNNASVAKVSPKFFIR